MRPRVVCISLSVLLIAACGGVGTEPSDGGAETDAGPGQVIRTLAYYYDNRACMSEPDSSGGRTASESSCTTDASCTDSAFPACRHLEEILTDAEVDDLGPDVLSPPAPIAIARPSDYRIRYVPLCADGSGDHEYAIGNPNGHAPSCTSDEFIRCADGTRPYYFINPADQSSDQWLVWAGSGGYNLFSEFSAWRGMHQERGAFGYVWAPPSTRGGLGGIFANQSGTDFDDYNRVWIEKCTPDRWQGTATATEVNQAESCDSVIDSCVGTLDPPANDPNREVAVFFHGAKIVEAVLNDLTSSVRLFDEAGQVVNQAPSLSAADKVIFSCHSNGCNGMTHRLDQRALLVSQLAPLATTLAIFNNFFTAALEGEHAFDSAIVEAVLTELASQTTLYDDSGSTVAVLPPLADANNVILSCHSNGCNGLQLSFDERASFIEAIAPAAVVRAVFNNFFVASLEGEYAAVEGAAEGNVLNQRSLYDHITTGFSIALTETSEQAPISAATYESGESVLTHERFGATLDASCLSSHAGGSLAPCHDTMHVLANHLNHEFFYVLAQRDQSLSKGLGIKAPYCDGTSELPYGCSFAGVKLGWVGLIRKQLADILIEGPTRRGEASSGPGSYARTAIWAPDSPTHAGWQDTVVAIIQSWQPRALRPLAATSLHSIKPSPTGYRVGLNASLSKTCSFSTAARATPHWDYPSQLRGSSGRMHCQPASKFDRSDRYRSEQPPS